MRRRIRNYIEYGPWEEYVDRGEKYLNIFCWMAIIFAILYFLPTAIRIVLWGP